MYSETQNIKARTPYIWQRLTLDSTKTPQTWAQTVASEVQRPEVLLTPFHM